MVTFLSNKAIFLANLSALLLNLHTYVKLTSLPNVRTLEFDQTKFMQYSIEKRPLFTFSLHPWKTETFINRNRENCDEFLGNIRWSLVFVVKSAAHNIARRNVIRSTWGKVKIFDDAKFELVFVLGKTNDVILSKEIQDENLRYGDILQFNYLDTSQHVSEKVLAGMQWASSLPSDWFYVSIDDDIAVNFDNLMDYFDNLVENHTGNNGKIQFEDVPMVCLYNYQGRDVPDRDLQSKYYMPESDYPLPYWPAYCRGGMYTTNSKMVAELYQKSRRTPHLYLDDVWITGFMRLKLGQGNRNILAAPASVMAEKEDLEFSKVIAKHFEGNIAAKRSDVPALLSGAWKSHESLLQYRIRCEMD